MDELYHITAGVVRLKCQVTTLYQHDLTLHQHRAKYLIFSSDNLFMYIFVFFFFLGAARNLV